MSRALRALGYAVGRRRATTLMREAGIWVRYRKRYRLTTQSRHRHPVCPNRLQRQFRVEKPNQAWVGDISYIWTHAEIFKVVVASVVRRHAAFLAGVFASLEELSWVSVRFGLR